MPIIYRCIISELVNSEVVMVTGVFGCSDLQKKTVTDE